MLPSMSKGLRTSRSEFMPVALFHLDIEMLGGFLDVGKGDIPIGISDTLNLIEPRHGITNMCCICHRFFPCAGKSEGRGWQ